MTKHVVLLDATMSMSGEPLNRSIAHAKAYHPDATAYAFTGDRMVWKGSVSALSAPVIEPLLSGPSGIVHALTLVRVDHGKTDDGVATVVYTDGDIPDFDASDAIGSGGVLRVTRAEAVDRLRDPMKDKGFRVLPVPDVDAITGLPLARIHSMLDHIDAISADRAVAFAAQTAKDLRRALGSSDDAFHAAARGHWAGRLRLSLESIGVRIGPDDVIDTAFVRAFWRRELDNVVTRCGAIGSSATYNLMTQADLQAVREMVEMVEMTA